MWFSKYTSEQTNRQTDRHTDSLIAILRTSPWGEVIIEYQGTSNRPKVRVSNVSTDIKCTVVLVDPVKDVTEVK